VFYVLRFHVFKTFGYRVALAANKPDSVLVLDAAVVETAVPFPAFALVNVKAGEVL
jgi:hypothetical protein